MVDCIEGLLQLQVELSVFTVQTVAYCERLNAANCEPIDWVNTVAQYTLSKHWGQCKYHIGEY